ncbi:MAG: DUF4124 domain-containing protein [Gammaproteobacteria bacterium]|nr:DUF4124 domain-containing protein [Gammaproteobacteria bacterium]
MKKLFIKLIIVTIVLLTVPYYFLGGSLPLPGFLQGIFSGSSAGKKPLSATSVTTDRDVTVYKWVDENGQTHFSEKPPVGETAQTMELKTDTNVVQGTKIPEQEQQEDGFGGRIISLGKSSGSKSDSDSDSGDEASDSGLENPYTPEGLQKLIDDANNVSKLMEQRQLQ